MEIDNVTPQVKEPQGYTINFTPEAFDKLVQVGQQAKLIQKYKQDIINAKKKSGNKELKDIQTQFISKFFTSFDDLSPLMLANFVENVFIGFTYNETNVANLMTERHQIWTQIQGLYEQKKISTESIKNLVKVLGIDIYSSSAISMNNEELEGFAKGIEDNSVLTLFDAKIIEKRLEKVAIQQNIKKILNSDLNDALFVDDLEKIRDANCFNSKEYKSYMAKITALAASFNTEAPQTHLDKLIAARLKSIPQVEYTDTTFKHNRVYLDMRYRDTEEKAVYENQTISDYQKHGFRIHHEKIDTIKDLNPEYVKNHLPEDVKLYKNSNGYYLVQKESQISKNDLCLLRDRYNETEQQ